MSEILQLADALDERVVPRWIHATGQTPQQSGYARDIQCAQAAAELRRLRAENETMKAKIEQYSAAVKYPLIFNGLSGTDIEEGLLRSGYALETAKAWRDGVRWAYKKLRDKNT